MSTLLLTAHKPLQPSAQQHLLELSCPEYMMIELLCPAVVLYWIYPGHRNVLANLCWRYCHCIRLFVGSVASQGRHSGSAHALDNSVESTKVLP